jgi:flagellar biosynthesis/type III secretory pathway chaperone
MPVSSRTREYLASLEDTLVQEFRTLQNLTTLTKDERTLMAKNDSAALMKLVEQKECVLDSFNLLEESRRTLTQEAARSLGVQMKTDALTELLPSLDIGVAGRLNRLTEGILMLASQVRDLNSGNQALAGAAIDWIGAAQAFLINLYQPEAGYRPPGIFPTVEKASLWGIDQKA